MPDSIAGNTYSARLAVSSACQHHPDITTAEALVPLVYRLKQGIEV